MAKENKRSQNRALWKDVDIKNDFLEASDDAEDIDISDYNKPNMVLYMANVNYARHLLRLSDSLKPVERRILYTMYLHGLRPGKFEKSISVQGSVTKIHPHGGASIYDTMINMAQYWKKQIPLLDIDGSIGTEVSAICAADRYTEASLSQYAWDCFFKDFDPDCVQTIFSTAGNIMEPVSLPSRYPNILINGGTGIAIGNAFTIPPFNINEVVDTIKKMLYNDSEEHVYLVPDFPTGCDIIDDENSIKQICETGMGKLRIRAKTEIIDDGRNWAIRITNLPWGTTQESIVDALVKHTKSGAIPVKDIKPKHEAMVDSKGNAISHVDLWVIFDKAYDPYAMREKLYRKTPLETTLSINFRVVLEDLRLSEDGNTSLNYLIRQWIDERREYKRRLLNKKISKTTAQIELLKILIEMCTGKNLETTMSIIKNSSDDKLAENLMKKYGMSSYQAERIADMKTRAFTKSALERYKVELKENEAELKNLYKMVKSEKMIDDIIAAELEELRKYAKPRQSELINLENGQVMDTDTEYFLIVTKRGGIKKVSKAAVERTNRGFGKYAQGDYPTKVLRVKNMDSILFIDSFGKFSVIKAGDIDALTLSDLPSKAYTYTRLEGEIIAMQYFQGKTSAKWLKKNKVGDLFLVTLSRDGYGKKIELKELIQMSDDGRKTIKNMRLTKLKANDFLTHADYYLGDSHLMLYTRQGDYNYITADMIPSSSRDAIGNLLVKLKSDDYCVGCSAVDRNAEFVVIVTEKGYMKKCELQYMGNPSIGKDTSYLATLDANDGVVFVGTAKSKVTVCTKLGVTDVDLEEVKTMGRKAKPVRKVPMQSGDNIIRVVTE